MYCVQVILTSSYEDNMEGVHLKNKLEQDQAMTEFVAGRLAAGEMGNGIQLENIKPKEKKKKEAMYQAHGFDEYISEYMVSLNRSLPDRRDDWCKQPENQKVPVKNLPATSVVVIFHNEAWSTLIRTVYSVLNRSPTHLIHEIVLVDDASTLSHLGSRLDQEVEKMDKVRLNDDKRTRREIADIDGVADETIKQSYKLMLPRAVELFPQDFKFTTPIENLPQN